jgi:putative PIN family toxin of toxin-antitoxin system
MRLVVDTNVFVSAALKNASWPGWTIRWLATYGGLLKSAATGEEVFAVLQRPCIAAKIAPVFHANVRQLFARAELVAITRAVTGCRDPKDDTFLELAVNVHADVIVSGDDDLLTLDTFRGIPVITPAAFGLAHPP